MKFMPMSDEVKIALIDLVKEACVAAKDVAVAYFQNKTK